MTGETVAEDCKHPDCVYRQKFDIKGTPWCAYSSMTGRIRGCSISECDKYRKGRKRVRIEKATLYCEWEIEEE